jgi:hypothetical protein
MWNTLAKKLELVVNLTLIFAVLLLSILLVKTYLFNRSQNAPSYSGEANEVRPGTRVNLPNENWASNGRTLLLSLSTDCGSSTASAPFYQRLNQQQVNAKLVAVLPQTTNQSEEYLKKLDVKVNEIREALPDSLGILGTPTLVLVNDGGIVTDVWEGKLTPDQENQVLSRLQPKRK